MWDLDPSNVSRIVASIEDELGFALFQRTTRRLSLSDAGKIYINRIQPILAELQEAEEQARDARNNASGLLTITASNAFAEVKLLPLLTGFRGAYPDIQLRLLTTDRNVDLIEDNVDLVIRLSPAFQSELIGVKLLDTRYRVCATPELLSRHSPVKSPEDLCELPVVVLDLPHYRNAWHFEGRELQTQELSPDITVSGALALRTSLLQGLGAGLVADWLVEDELKQGVLVDVFPQYRVTATDFETGAWLLYPSRRFLPLKTRVAIDFFKQHLRSL